MSERRAAYRCRGPLERVSHPEDENERGPLPVRRFVRTLLRHKETPQFTKSVVAFSNTAYLIEIGIGEPDYHMLQASKAADRMGLTPEEISRASTVAGTLWERYKGITGLIPEPAQLYQPLTSEAAEGVQGYLRLGQKTKEKTDLTETTDSLTKHQLINLIAKKTHKTKKNTQEIIDSVLTEITQQMLDGKKIVLQGFGTFQMTTRGERTVLSHGVERHVQAHSYPQFTPGKTLKRVIRNNS